VCRVFGEPEEIRNGVRVLPTVPTSSDDGQTIFTLGSLINDPDIEDPKLLAGQTFEIDINRPNLKMWLSSELKWQAVKCYLQYHLTRIEDYYEYFSPAEFQGLKNHDDNTFTPSSIEYKASELSDEGNWLPITDKVRESIKKSAVKPIRMKVLDLNYVKTYLIEFPAGGILAIPQNAGYEFNNVMY
jgi:hypothetical protein